MRPISKDTLKRLCDEFPALPWTEEDFDELVTPRSGLITGFGELLREIAQLQALDLDDIAPAGTVTSPEEA